MLSAGWPQATSPATAWWSVLKKRWLFCRSFGPGRKMCDFCEAHVSDTKEEINKTRHLNLFVNRGRCKEMSDLKRAQSVGFDFHFQVLKIKNSRKKKPLTYFFQVFGAHSNSHFIVKILNL